MQGGEGAHDVWALVLVIADIGGYTEYMRTHRMSLAHAEVNTGRLLDRVIDAARGFDLSRSRATPRSSPARPTALRREAAVTRDPPRAAAMHRAFHVERQLRRPQPVPCAGCEQAGALTLKFVAHVGEVATQTIRDRRKLVGIDVILVHRLLKDPVSAAGVRRAVRRPPRGRCRRHSPSRCTTSHRRPRRGRPRSVPTTSTWTISASRCRRCRRRPRASASAGRSRSPAPACPTCSGCAAGASAPAG